MSIPRELIIQKGKDEVYTSYITELRDAYIHEMGFEIDRLKNKCRDRFAEYNGFSLTRRVFSLGELYEGKLKKDCPEVFRPADRTCYLRKGEPAAIIIEAKKASYDINTFQALAYRNFLKIYVISSFKNPLKNIAVVFVRHARLKADYEHIAGKSKE